MIENPIESPRRARMDRLVGLLFIAFAVLCGFLIIALVPSILAVERDHPGTWSPIEYLLMIVGFGVLALFAAAALKGAIYSLGMIREKPRVPKSLEKGEPTPTTEVAPPSKL